MGIKIHSNKNIIKKYDCGPIDFLYYIYNAELVLSSSFHGTVFSIIFNKPFYAINGINDFRINTLLINTNLNNRSISYDFDIDIVDNYNKINFEQANSIIEKERLNSEEYLKDALEIR